MSSTTSSISVICSQCGRDCGFHWTIINGHAVCDFCWPTHQRLCANTDGESCPVAALRSRIATLEGQVEQAREALEVIANALKATERQGRPAMSDKTPAGDVEAIKARLEAHDQQRERFGYCDETAPQTWEADVCALIARIEADGERMEAAKALRRAAGEANAELVVSRDVLRAFGVLNPALCAYDAALAALEGRE